MNTNLKQGYKRTYSDPKKNKKVIEDIHSVLEEENQIDDKKIINAPTVEKEPIKSKEISFDADKTLNINENGYSNSVESVNNDDSDEFLPRVGQTLVDVIGSVGEGLFKGVEGVVDSVVGLAGGIGGVFGADTDWAKNFIERNYTDELYGNALDEYTKGSYLNEGNGKIVKRSQNLRFSRVVKLI